MATSVSQLLRKCSLRDAEVKNVLEILAFDAGAFDILGGVAAAVVEARRTATFPASNPSKRA